jgi:hypothetical protein
MTDILTSKTGNGTCHPRSYSQTLNRLCIVPIVVVFTKCEALEIKAKGNIVLTGLTGAELSRQATEEAHRILQEEFYSVLENAGHPIDQVVQLECK